MGKYGAKGTVGPAPGFSWAEVRCTDGSMPSFVGRRRAVYQARYLNSLRARVARGYGVKRSHVAIIVNSWYRSPSFNRRIGGARSSQHIQTRATDLVIVVRTKKGKVVRLAPRTTAAYAEKVRAFNKGGIGVYPNFTHLDHRPNGPARWSG